MFMYLNEKKSNSRLVLVPLNLSKAFDVFHTWLLKDIGSLSLTRQQNNSDVIISEDDRHFETRSTARQCSVTNTVQRIHEPYIRCGRRIYIMPMTAPNTQ